MNTFEKATRTKLRFATSKGSLSVEELWDLSLQSLDALAKGVNKALQASQEESFLPSASTKTGSTTAKLQLDLLKHIIKVKVDEKDVRANRAAKAAQDAKIDELIEAKKGEGLASLSIEDLEKLKSESA